VGGGGGGGGGGGVQAVVACFNGPFRHTCDSEVPTHLISEPPSSHPKPPFVLIRRVISGFRSEVDENCALLGCYTASCGDFLPTFRGNLSVPSSGIKNPNRKHLLVTLLRLEFVVSVFVIHLYLCNLNCCFFGSLFYFFLFVRYHWVCFGFHNSYKGLLTPADGTDRLSRKVDNKLPLLAV